MDETKGLSMATRADVARLAGVSEAAVSYAISGKRPISDATRQRVFAAMEKLDYRPHAMARGLAGGKSMIIALLFPTRERGISNADLEYVLGAANASRELGYHLLLWPTDGFDVLETLSLQKAGMIDGVLLMEVRMEDDRVDVLAAAGVPVGLIGRTRDIREGVVFADRDFAAATEQAIEYLAGLGHTRIGFLGGSESSFQRGFGAVIRAEDAYLSAATRHRISPQLFRVDPTVEAGRRFYLHELTKPDAPTALVAMNADGAIGVMAAAHDDGRRVPRELSVLSIATPDNLVAVTSPRMTTIAPPAREIGAAAAQQLISRLGGVEVPGVRELWTGDIAVRGSTGPAPSRASGTHT